MKEKVYVVVYDKKHIVDGTNSDQVGKSKLLLLKKYKYPNWNQAKTAHYSTVQLDYNFKT